MSERDIKIKSETSLCEGFCSVRRYELEQKRFDGSWTPTYTREFVAKPSAVGALPYDPKLNLVVLIEQFRVGALGQSSMPWLIEVVSGIMDKGNQESAEEVVRREMREETGLEITALILIYDYFTTPGYSAEKLKLFCAKVDATKAPEFCGLKEEYEDIKVHTLSSCDAFLAMRSGKINNGSTIIALQWLELNIDLVRKKWQDAVE